MAGFYAHASSDAHASSACSDLSRDPLDSWLRALRYWLKGAGLVVVLISPVKDFFVFYSQYAKKVDLNSYEE